MISTKTFLYTQVVPSIIWIINHNMNIMSCSVSILYYNGIAISPAFVTQVDRNTTHVMFQIPTAGEAHLVGMGMYEERGDFEFN